MAKNGKLGGKILVVRVIMAAIGVMIGYGLIRFSIVTLSEGNNDDIATMIFLVPSVLLIRLGCKRKGMDANDWLQTMVDASDYPKAIVREFSA